MGTILKVICEVKWQLWWGNCWYDLVFDGGLSALLDSWPSMFGSFLCVYLFPRLCGHLHVWGSSGLELIYHCHLFTISYSFSPSITKGEEQIMWVNYEITEAVVLHRYPHISQSYNKVTSYETLFLYTSQ